MLKKYLPELLVVLLITILGFALWTQTNRLNAAKNQIQAVQLAFDQYKVEQQAEVQKERQAELERHAAALSKKEKDNENLRNQNIALHTRFTNAERLLNTANANLRKARENADNGTCEDARNAARMCTDLYTKLDTRVRKDERRISAVGQYADRLKIELEACVAIR